MSLLNIVRTKVVKSFAWMKPSFAASVAKFCADRLHTPEVFLLLTDPRQEQTYAELMLKLQPVCGSQLTIGTLHDLENGDYREVIIVHSHYDQELLFNVVDHPSTTHVIYVAEHGSSVFRQMEELGSNGAYYNTSGMVDIDYAYKTACETYTPAENGNTEGELVSMKYRMLLENV